MMPPAEKTRNLVTRDNPFPGLRPFELEESEFFFGRDTETNELLSRLRQTRFLAVIGESGSGKSSIVRAGMLAALRAGFMVDSAGSWHFAVMRPGEDPIARLAEALARPDALGHPDGLSGEQESIILATLRRGARGLIEAAREGPLPPSCQLLVLVDQFEELFRFMHVNAGGAARETARAFIKLLLEASAQREVPIYMVLTMRSEYLGHCATLPGLAEAISDGLYLVPQMARTELRETIESPVALAGAKITNRLVNRLLNDVRDDADQLPVLQHALMRLWSLRCASDPNPLDLADYRKIIANGHTSSEQASLSSPDEKGQLGWLAMALSAHADEAFGQLSAEQQRIAKTLFRCLAERAETGLDTRRPTALKTVAAVAGVSCAQVATVVEAFRHHDLSFLTPAAPVSLEPDTTLDISHESLIRNWDRLRRWVQEEADSAAEYKRLEETAIRWQQNKAALYRSPDLDNSLRWRETEKPSTYWAARYGGNFELAMAFLDASDEKRKQDKQEADAARQREKALKRAWRVAWLGGLGLIITGCLTVWAMTERHNAQLEAARAEDAEKNALDQEAKAEAAKTEAQSQADKAKAAEEDAKLQAAKASAAEKDAKRQTTIANALRLVEQPESIAERHPQATVLQAAELFQAPLRAKESPIPAAAQALQQALGRIGGFGLGHHADKVKSVVTSPDGRWLATGSDDCTAQLWDLTNPNPAALPIVLFGHSKAVYVVGFSPDGRWLATGSFDGTTRLWDMKAADPSNKSMLLKGSSEVWCLAFSADSHWLATGHRDGSIRLWDVTAVNDSLSPRDFIGHQGGIRALGFSRDGRWLASASADKTARLWDLQAAGAKGQSVLLPGHDDVVVALAFSPDGKWLATGCDDKNVRLWSLTAKALPGSAMLLPGNSAGVVCLAFSPDGRWLASGGQDKTARLWHLMPKGPPERPIVLQGHENTVMKLAFTPDNRRLATASADNTVRLWELNARLLVGVKPATNGAAIVSMMGSPLDNLSLLAASASNSTPSQAGRQASVEPVTIAPSVVLRGHDDVVYDLAISADGRWLATGSYDSTARLWDLKHREDFAASPTVLRGTKSIIDTIAVSPDGRWLASGSRDKKARLWPLKDGSPSGPPLVLAGHNGAVFTVAFSPDSRRLATGSWDKTIRLWDLSSAVDKPSFVVLNGHNSAVSAVVFSPDGKWLASSSSNEDMVLLWDLGAKAPTPRPIPVSKGDNVNALAFSADSLRLAAGGRNRVVSVFQLGASSPVPLFTLPGHTGAIEALAFSQDGRWLVSGSDDKTARRWDLGVKDPSQQPTVLRGHEGSVIALAISPDSLSLATASGDRTTRLWDLTANDPNAEPIVLRGHTDMVFAVAFTPDGRRLATASADTTIRLWLLQSDDLLKLAAATVGRNFTQQDWAKYFPGQIYRKTFSDMPSPAVALDLLLTDGQARVDGQLTAQDSWDSVRPASYCKVYAVPLAAGKRYQIEMVSTAVDPYLRLEDDNRSTLASGDDSGSGHYGQIWFDCQRQGTYRIITTTAKAGELGTFTLNVQQLADAVEPRPVVELLLKDDPTRVEGQLTLQDAWEKGLAGHYCKIYTVQLDSGKGYQIDMTSTKAVPYLRLEDEAGNLLAFDAKNGGDYGARILFASQRKGAYRIVATTFNPVDTGDFALTIKQVLAPVPDKIALTGGQARIDAQLTIQDFKDSVRRGSFSKAFEILLIAGNTYQIDMQSTKVDSFLRLEDSGRNQLAFDDDSGGGRNARITYPCVQDGIYRIIATTYGMGEMGDFSLTVRQLPKSNPPKS